MKNALKIASNILSGGAVRDIAAEALLWQADASLVHVGGLESASFVQASPLGKDVTWITHLGSQMIRQAGTIKQYKYIANNTNALAGTAKFKLHRWTGTTYSYVSETPAHSFPSESPRTIQVYTLATPQACAVGDIIGSYSTLASLAAATVTGTSILRWVASDVTADNAFANVINNLACEIEALSNRPYLAVIGDSISAGETTWHGPFDDSGLSGTIAHDPAYVLAQFYSGLQYQNLSKSGATFATIASTYAPIAAAVTPHTLIIHCGVNDIDTGRSWAQVEANLDTIKGILVAAGVEKILIDEIIPSSNLDDTEAALVRTWNGNLAVWCAANGATLIACHDAFGQTRVSTGELDDLKATYDIGDGSHLNDAGNSLLVSFWKSAL